MSDQNQKIIEENQEIADQMEATAKASEKVKDQPIEGTQNQEKIKIPQDVAFKLRLQQFDKDIAALEAQAADLKAQKADFIFNQNMQSVTMQHKNDILRKQIEEETRKRVEQELKTKKN